MKIEIDKSNPGRLIFVSDDNDTAEDQAFLDRISQYELIAKGASVEVFQSGKKILHINPFDRTVLVCEPEGLALANDFGAKRFIIGAAREQLTAEQAGAAAFGRDRSFSMPDSGLANPILAGYRMVDFSGLQSVYKTNRHQLYRNLAQLFGDCADFTPGKRKEYFSGGSMQDKYCRFNSGNKHMFLLSENNEIMGTISLAMDCYFYDEVVKYPELLDGDQEFNYNLKLMQLAQETDEEKKEILKADIATIAEPARKQLLSVLFAAARVFFSSMANKQAAFIRVAADREGAYEELGCAKENTGILVIHGQPKPQLMMLDTHMKLWAAQQLEAIRAKVSAFSLSRPKVEAAVEDVINEEEKQVVRPGSSQ